MALERTQADFEKFADEMPYLAMESILYGKINHSFDTKDPSLKNIHTRIFSEITDLKYSRDNLITLLKHENPKVRTLAMTALFNREDPKLLPFIYELTNDNAPTFDEHPEIAYANFVAIGIGPPQKEQTVGYIAQNMIGFYTKNSDLYNTIRSAEDLGFEKYWEARKDRAFCASWFLVKMTRAYQRAAQPYEKRIELFPALKPNNPPRQEEADEIQAISNSIYNLPEDDRAWTLLWFAGRFEGKDLINEKELVDLCKKLGPEKLMLMLQRKILSDDPDLNPEARYNWPYHKMCIFVLQHASELLKKDFGPELLEIESRERERKNTPGLNDMVNAWWAIAAAELQPEKASEILHAAYKRFPGLYQSHDRTDFSVALLKTCGESEIKFLANWFYNNNHPNLTYPNYGSAFIQGITQPEAPAARAMIAALIRHDRFEEMNWHSLNEIAKTVNRWTSPPIFTIDELREPRHPLGAYQFDRQMDKAEKEFPAETEKLLKVLQEWRQKLRDSVPLWLPE